MKTTRVVVKHGNRHLGTFVVPIGYVVCLDCLVPRPKSPVCLKCGSIGIAEPECVEQESKS